MRYTKTSRPRPPVGVRRRLLAAALAGAALVAPAGGGQGSAGFERLDDAADLLRAGRIAEAEAALSRILRASPADANALNLLGVVRAQQGRQAEAEDLFARAIAASPTLVPAHLNLGRIYLARGETTLAEASLRRAADLDPRRPDVAVALATALERSGRLAEAAALVEGLPPGAAGIDGALVLVGCYLGLGRPADADAVAARLAGALRADPEGLAELAMRFTRNGRPDRAVSILSAAGPAEHSFPVRYALGAAHERAGMLPAAAKAYDEALAAKPDDVPTLLARARVARAAGEPERALSLLVRARKLAPESPPVLYDFGWTALSLNLVLDAVPVLEKLQRLRPETPGYLYALAIARLNNRQPVVARELAERYIAKWPADARGHFLFGVTLYGLKQFAAARAALERSLAIAAYPDSYYYLGMIAHAADDEASAAAWLGRALEADPRLAAAHTALGVIAVKAKDYASARVELERALELDPDDLTALYQLGIVYARTGDRESARAVTARTAAARERKTREEMIGFRLVDAPGADR